MKTFKEKVIFYTKLKLAEDNNINIPHYITEGIVFFKTSVKLNNLLKKIERRALKSGDSTIGIDKMIKQMKSIRDQFITIEQKYAHSDKINKEQVKKDYKDLVLKYSALLNTLKDSTTVKILKGLGLAAVVAISILGVSSFISDLGVAENLAVNDLLKSDKNDFEKGLVKGSYELTMHAKGLDPDNWAEQMQGKKAAWESLTKWARAANPNLTPEFDQSDKDFSNLNKVASIAGGALSIGAGTLLIKLTDKAYKETTIFKRTKDVLKELEKKEQD